jgi:hypothetical protein
MKWSHLFKTLFVCSTLASLPLMAGAADKPAKHARGTGWVGIYLSATDDGAKVEAVVRDSPADKAGLRAGDVVKQVNKKAVHSPADLSEAVRRTAAGETLALTIARDDSEQTVSLKVEARPSWYGGSAPFWAPPYHWPEGMKDWREYVPPAVGRESSEALKRLEKEIDKLRQQMEELRKKLDERFSGKKGSNI